MAPPSVRLGSRFFGITPGVDSWLSSKDVRLHCRESGSFAPPRGRARRAGRIASAASDGACRASNRSHRFFVVLRRPGVLRRLVRALEAEQLVGLFRVQHLGFGPVYFETGAPSDTSRAWRDP